ncbi:TPA: zinc-binding dehydrogenase [Vibrio alginolyticus]|uniref:zinc-binding dehydrogenase n=1 Tax=Vibrio TaxID=662 RepID=UPI0006CA99DE|nr:MULTISPECIES: zinc-binding dehydrogenase [Vibrio]EGQ8471888.1 zinc-binding dehydrogenase [Vibrio alginolyticus]EGR1572271.1 dehydrogenase [Vibrio alginolyticus]EJL6750713.1 zinc-binding dehydrogenase [Vibrio alginolyticus]EJL6857402.1 zinc-binding dehydrogenase [Vibrio alginolyticus]EJL8715660.1 zinc-binding dehydrogenase [Vibrio alginolyticus]
MRAITYQRDNDTFSLSELPTPKLETQFDVLVKVNAVGLNPVDAKIRYWSDMVTNMDNNFVGGLDVSGEIVSVGDAVVDWKVGDKVLYHGNMRRHHGGFAEFAIHDSRTLIKHPQVPVEVAASTPCAAWTAYRALVDKLDISNRSSIFIAGGAGGVGSFAIQLAKTFGVEQIISTSSEANHAYLSSLGATHTIDYHHEDVVQRVMDITGNHGVEVALDCVGGDNDRIAASVLTFEGEMVELVKTVDPSQYPDAFLKGLGFHQISLGSGHVFGERGFASIVNAGKEVSELLENGELEVPKLKIIGLEDVGNALLDMRNQRTVGKIVVNLNQK